VLHNIKSASSFTTYASIELINVNITWPFFATSHGKSPCDGMGGTVKQSAAMDSLQRSLNNQITEFMSMMMDHFTKMLLTIMSDIKSMLHHLFSKVSTIKRTHTFHYLELISSS